MSELPKTWRVRQVGDNCSDLDLQGKWYAPDSDDSTWTQREIAPLTQTINGRTYGLSQHNGAVWHRANLELPSQAVASGALIAMNAGVVILTRGHS